MSANQFSALLTVIIPQLIEKVSQGQNIDELTALKQVYQSQFLADLSDESTKLWHYGPVTLASLYEMDRAGQAWNYPEAA